MSVTTSTSTSSSGSTTTVGTTVRNEAGGGGETHVVDIFLSLDASKLQHDPTGSPNPTASAHAEATLMCWWKEQKVYPDTALTFDYKVKWRSALPFFDTATGFAIVFDRTTDEVFYHDISFHRMPVIVLKPFPGKLAKLPKLAKKGALPRPEKSSKPK